MYQQAAHSVKTKIEYTKAYHETGARGAVAGDDLSHKVASFWSTEHNLNATPIAVFAHPGGANILPNQ